MSSENFDINDFSKDKEEFQKEQNELLKFALDSRFFSPWKEYKKEGFNPKESLGSESSLEIYLTSTCNQKCEYCYLVKYKDLYPQEFNNKDIILKNLRILYDWVLEEEFLIRQAEFFSGEIWHTAYGLEVLEITLEYIKKGMKIEGFMIPSNCSFILNEEQTCKIQNYIDKFGEYGIVLQFSISVDGKIIEEMNRPLNDKTLSRTDEFYDRLFAFAKHNNFLFHPMVSAKSSKYWIENYKWWVKKLDEYGYNPYQDLMMLEVRNDDWTPEYIEDYNNFMDYLIDELYKDNGYDLDKFVNVLFNLDLRNPDDNEDYHSQANPSGYVPYLLLEAFNFPGCTVASSLTVRVGDLAICPCHRTAYNKNLFGWFKVEDGKIVDIVANNPQIAIKILFGNQDLYSFECDVCPYAPICLKGCFGSQMEHNQDPFVNVPVVCDFFRSKYKHIIDKMESMGALDKLREKNSPYLVTHHMISRLLSIVEEIQEYEKNRRK